MMFYSASNALMVNSHYGSHILRLDLVLNIVYRPIIDTTYLSMPALLACLVALGQSVPIGSPDILGTQKGLPQNTISKAHVS